VRLTIPRTKLGVTLRTRRIRRGLQAHCTLVLDVTGHAFGSKCLVGVVQGCIVAREAGLVGHLRGEGASLGNVAERALLRKYSVSMGELPARVHFLSALSALRDEPRRCYQGDRH